MHRIYKADINVYKYIYIRFTNYFYKGEQDI